MQQQIGQWYEKHGEKAVELSKELWGYREASLQEFKSCKAVARFMEGEGFAVKQIDAENRGGEPNTVVARWGAGKPVIGILGELDALPGLGQEALPHQAPLEGPGHGCGHNLMGAGNAAAACALKEAMEAEGLAGTVVYIGCPAEETLQGKVFLARDGYFDDLDLALVWHPGACDMNFGEMEMNAMTSVLYKFYGRTAHGAHPWEGRSALDAAELTSIGSQYLREHMTEKCRLHHVYHAAGEQPNIVPDFASIYFYIRSQDDYNEELVRRMNLIAQGAATMTETRMEMEVKTSCHGYFCNHTLAKYTYEAALKVPALAYGEEDYAFARELYQNVTGNPAPAETIPTGLKKPDGEVKYSYGSTDVGEASYVVPTIQVFGCGAVKDMPSHHWGIAAGAGVGIGQKAMLYAGKVLAQTGYDAVKNPKIIEESWAEFREKFGTEKPYVCRLK
ncbi:MAG: amidohydrolase [Oscillospiraceae bacterium]|nr:amidohydrolase [Oscillospiraceae bacterium]